MLPGVRATVVGAGPCGIGVADTLARLGARVGVAERGSPPDRRASDDAWAEPALRECAQPRRCSRRRW
ncbi:NAD-binding protein [Streptomyces sp. NPDC001046]|uniref:NAD-binding protein n=1 Tax=Streptomyces sp. NPDC001046 TaxID=3364543 RepID=UPI00367C93AE